MKKIIALLCMVTLCISLVACENDKGSGNDKTANDTAQRAENNKKETQATEDDSVRLLKAQQRKLQQRPRVINQLYIFLLQEIQKQLIADVLAKTLDDRRQLLKIMSMNHYDLEENSRMELLVEFKVSYGNAMKTVMELLTKFRKDMDQKKRQEFVYSFFPFMFGIYPYTVVTEKQKGATKAYEQKSFH